ncbi:MAG: serine hydrolase domain-containing protein [Bacillota bacterium]|nr:serine hydrolase domain-containing protein [Bacillota bacterium]
MFLDDFIAETKKRELNIFSIIVYKEGQLFCEAHMRPERAVNQYSVSKAFTCCSAGLAIEEGYIDLDTKVSDVLFEHMPKVPNERLLKITLYDLLTMTSGHGEAYLMPGQRDKYSEHDWIAYTLRQPIVYEPGEKFCYDNSLSYLICAMLEKKIGYSLSEYLTSRLFEPLGIHSFSWGKCPLGYIFGGSDLRITTRQMASVGLLFTSRKKGILSEDFLNLATKKHIDTDWYGEGSYGYGFQLWQCKKPGIIRAEGALGQLCIIDRNKDIVIAINSQEQKCASDNRLIFEYLWDTVYDRL